MNLMNKEYYYRELQEDVLDANYNNGMIAATIVFTLASFIANFGQAVTGFGMAMIFWFVFTIGDFVGLLNHCPEDTCGVKQAAFFQALSLASVSPLLLWQTRAAIQKYGNKTLLTAFIPATIIGTPVGQLLQEIISAEVVRIVVGVSILLVSAFETMRLIKNRRTANKAAAEEPELEDNTCNDLTTKKKNTENVLGEDASENSQECSNMMKERNDHLESEESAANDQDKNELMQDEESQLEISPSSTPSSENVDDEDDEKVFVPNHVGGYKFWLLGFILGFISGFLGGLSGLRSGPILIFFLHFDYPKPIIRANLMIVTCVNTFVRLIYYIVEDIAQGQNDLVWFEKDIWYLYVCIIVAGIIGVPLGTWIEPKIDQNKYNAIIVIALIIAGIMNTTKGTIDIASQ